MFCFVSLLTIFFLFFPLYLLFFSILTVHGHGHGHGLMLILLGALLIHLPGAEIVWGVLEILQGSVVHGSSRLVKGLISAICLAVFVTLGTLIH